METFLLVSFNKKKITLNPEHVKLKTTHQKEFILKNYYSDPSAIFKKDEIICRSVHQSQIPLGSSKHHYDLTNQRSYFDAEIRPADYGYGFKGTLELSDDGYDLADVEITVTDYFGRSDIFTTDFLTEEPPRELLEGMSYYFSDWQQQGITVLNLRIDYRGALVTTDNGFHIDYPIDIQGEGREHTEKEDKIIDIGLGDMTPFSWRKLGDSSCEDMQFNHLLRSDCVWLLKVLSELRANPEQVNQTAIDDIRFILHRFVRFLRPVILFQIESILESTEQVKYKDLAIEIKQKFVLLETLSSAETLDFYRLIEGVRTNWSEILSLLWLNNKEVIKPLVEQKLSEVVDEKFKVIYPVSKYKLAMEYIFYSVLGKSLKLNASINQEQIVKRIGKYTVWCKYRKLNFFKTHGNFLNQYSLKLCKKTKIFE
jgi:hypothetical protein